MKNLFLILTLFFFSCKKDSSSSSSLFESDVTYVLKDGYVGKLPLDSYKEIKIVSGALQLFPDDNCQSSKDYCKGLNLFMPVNVVSFREENKKTAICR